MSAGGLLPEWFLPDDERLARAVWSRIAEPGDREAVRLVARLGASAALAEVLSGRRAAAGGGHRWQVRLASTDPRLDLATLRRFGGRLVVPGDDEWPEPLDDLEDRVPFCLWVRGPLDLGEASRSAVAVVGSRAATRYGESVAASVAGGCAERGLTVVSGAALGIDAVAHRAALAVGGPTVAVLACGVDRIYPRSNEQLLHRIAAEGAVVSEVPPASAPTRWRFVERNRLIAALAGATVVVEAAFRSGALVTAREAADLSRPVGAVPGPVHSPESAGCHWLLRERDAVCVTEAAEAHELVARIGEVEPTPRSTRRAAHDDLPPGDLRVFDSVPLRRPAGQESIARAAGLELHDVAASLGRLELRGLVARDGSRWRRAPARSP